MENELYFEMGLGTRMRRLIETISTGMERVYDEAGVDVRTGHFYALYAVAERGPLTINAIANLAGFSHSAVSQTIKKLVGSGIVKARATEDGRQKQIALTPHGAHMVERMRPLWDAADSMVKDACRESGVDIIKAIAGVEAAFARCSVYDRLQEKLVGSPCPSFTVEDYHARWQQAFYDLNIWWMRDYFSVEPLDELMLGDPENQILAKGGEIFFAVTGDKSGNKSANTAVGAVALKREGPGLFELTKLGVDPSVQQGGMGRALCERVIERFQARGGETLFLETNTVLEPAIKLYQKLGFIEKPSPHASPYARSNYYMEWEGA